MNPVDFVVSAPLSRTGSESGTIYLYLGAGPSLVSDTYTQVSLQCIQQLHNTQITFRQLLAKS